MSSYSTAWYTSDLHLGHKNIIALDKRPFKDLDEMHETIKRNWNDSVKPTDCVYVLGDVSFGAPNWTKSIIRSLNGYKILIRGNHDGTVAHASRLGFDSVHDQYQYGREIYMIHNPYDEKGELVVPPDGQKLVLHGHLHLRGHAITQHKGVTYVNVGCMLWEFSPITLAEIKEEAGLG